MASRGDVTRVEGYAKMSECLDRLSMLDAGSGSLGKPLTVAKRVRAVLIKQKPAFTQAFNPSGSEATRLIYANAVAGLWHVTSLLCAEGVTFMKGGDGTYGPIVNRGAVDGMAGSVVVTRLEKFADAAEKYGFDQVVTETAQMVENETMHEAIPFIVGAGLAVTGLAAMLLVARDLAEKFYSLRGTFSRWLEVQARFLDMNAATLNRDASRNKQSEYAEKLRALADRIKVDDADTEKDANAAIRQDDKELAAAQTGAAPSSAGSRLL
jgi:hypothetical protein